MCTQVQLTSLQGSLADAERRVYESELIRRKLHNTIQVYRQLPRSRSAALAHAVGRVHATGQAEAAATRPDSLGNTQQGCHRTAAGLSHMVLVAVHQVPKHSCRFWPHPHSLHIPVVCLVVCALQELKGNIRVFARVRPPSDAEMASEANSGTGLSTEFPGTGEHSTAVIARAGQYLCSALVAMDAAHVWHVLCKPLTPRPTWGD